MKILLKFLTIVLTIFLLTGAASAIPLSGEVGIHGGSFVDFDWKTSDILPQLEGKVFGSGDFSGLSGDITLSSFNFATPDTPAADPLWSVGGFTFVLDTVSIVERNDTFLELSGVGTMRAAGFEDSTGMWAISLNKVGTSIFTFASTTAVPEPATLFFIGFGLVGMATLGHRKLRK